MKEINRVNLYYKVQKILEEKDSDEYNFILNHLDENFINNINNLLKLNITILEGVEYEFLIDVINTDKKIDKYKIIQIYNENIEKFKNYNSFLKDSEVKKLDLLVDTINKSKDEFYVFNAIIKLLNDINNKIIDNPQINKYNLEIDKRGNRFDYAQNQVFLSHAFDDKLYTFCLFIFMLEKNIFLYVDWMFSEEFDNGLDIKTNLSRELSNSRQLLFLRTINSEFSILGSGNIRGWCSWELGTFYAINRKNKDDKFYIEIYRRKTHSTPNKQLDGIKPLNKIESGNLI